MSLDPSNLPLLCALIRHYDELVDHVRRRFGDRGFAREVVHDVCVKLLEKREKEQVRLPLALLRKISYDQAVSSYRSERRRQTWIVEMPEPLDAVCPAQAPLQQYEAARELELLSEAISRLPERCQMVFVMHKIHDLPQAEVAVRMGISIKTVEKHLRLGLAACRLHLDRQQVGQ
ncbi:RNA polymerase sigma factor [Pseudomonas putida]|uniref:RNA polymerase sigma factor n=1 Tax=Pseudomonas putida TaxID=303 RepID=A0A7W2L4E1_PSEPU|nr:MULTISPECIES: RNA polymerase sigma factor [Pseudomonas]MBA6118259.1 RNA polymerase sigma factor [Pseudomonas putida]MBI6942027.1 RNA polymerase sigma factor [Pseudomonas putida]MBI6958342.1 RNA polymerase sigma factor [Pseudomonas putida]MCZ9640311.1 RNA polymerase sigma factor [Pseudomonas putida]MEC4877931.1 RNA polymerase sigma factor [Pseudomonas sp. NC26]